VLYNFRIQSSVGFYSNFGRFSRSNRSTVKPFDARTRRRPCAPRPPTPPRRQGRPFLRGPAPPEAAHLSQVPTPRDALKSSCHTSAHPSWRTACATHQADRRSVRGPLS
jgi:hypothetical protein